MESSSVITAPKENGSLELQEKDDAVDMNDGLAVEDGECTSVSIDRLPVQPSLQTPEHDKVDGLQEVKTDESPGSGEYASDEVIAESIVVASVNGDRVTLVHDEISADGGIISTEMAEISASGNPEQPAVDILDSLRQPNALDDSAEVSDSRTMDEHSMQNTANAPEKDTDEPVESESEVLEPSSEGEVGKGDAGQKTSQRKDSGSLQSGGESGGKDSPKGRFAVQAELNINSRPRRSVPRRSVFEMLQGEIRPPGHSKRSSMDTGSESDREPGPSRLANSRRLRLSASEQSEDLDDAKKGREERLQVAGQSPQIKRKILERDEMLITDSHQLCKRKYMQSPLGMNATTDEQETAFAADDFNFVGTEDRITQDSDITTNLEDEDDNLALASFRKDNRQHLSDCEPSDNQNILHDESAGDFGVDSESNFEDLEHGNRWHSCSSPGTLESPPNVLESPADQDDSHHSQVLAATSIKKNDKSKANSQNYGDTLQSDTSVTEDIKRPGTPWYLANRAGYEVSNDPKTLKHRIDELLKANTELRTRLKVVESRTSAKKFNIDFHSRKFSKARQPVFGSPADRKSTASHGKMGARVGAEWGTGASIFDKDAREKESALDRKEDKLRALDVELDERVSQLKASEGRLLRTERRLKEMEKTLEHRERVLKRMETSAERTEPEGKDDDVIPSNLEQPPGDPTGEPSGSAVEADGTKLERKEHELERLRRFLSEEREKLLPKQQRLTKWETVLRKKEYELRLREQNLVSASISKKHRISRSEEESDSDEVGKPLKTLNAKSRISVHKRNLIMKKRKEMMSSKVFKGATKAFNMNKIKTLASSRARPHLNALVGKKQSADGKPLKEYKLRRRC